jgi:hypothetical protein
MGFWVLPLCNFACTIHAELDHFGLRGNSWSSGSGMKKTVGRLEVSMEPTVTLALCKAINGHE